MTKILDKKNKIIQKLIASIIREQIDIKYDNLITITSVDIKNDSSKASVYISSLKNENEIIKILNTYTKKIKHSLTIKLKTYKIPNLEFKLDKTREYEIIFKKIKPDKNEK
jgi:ribosome-binding factor A